MWKKLGRIFKVEGETTLQTSHSFISFANVLDEKRIEIIFCARDQHGRSLPFKCVYNMADATIEHVSKTPILELGDIGTFDENGIFIMNPIPQKDRILMYYAGFPKHAKLRLSSAIGLVESRDGGKTYQKLYRGPIFNSLKDDVCFVGYGYVVFDKGMFKLWYLCCDRWELDHNQNEKHTYNLKYATSENGIDWQRNNIVAIDFEKDEYAIGKPSVRVDENGYHMWFSARGEHYQIFYAHSNDGVHWKRKKEPVLTCSKEGWDSEMVCYSTIFSFQEKDYMLYNGNGYGKSGIGLAVWSGKR